METTLHVVALGAHPDDIELSMCGLLLRFAAAGHRITWVVATDGAAAGGGRDPVLAARRGEEARAAAASCGAALILLDFPDGRLAWTAGVAAAIGGALETLAPDLIVTHASNDYHPDHRALSRCVDATAPLGAVLIDADNMLGRDFLPHFLVDTAAVFDQKRAALRHHESQRALNFDTVLDIWSRFRGLQAAPDGFRHAEAYRMRRGDPRPMLDRIGGYRSI